jgi:hypothetical protein
MQTVPEPSEATLPTAGLGSGGIYGPDNTLRFGKVADPSAPAKLVYSIALNANDTASPSAYRSELSGPFSGTAFTNDGSVWWCAVGIYPVDWDTALPSDDNQIVMQIHGGLAPPTAVFQINGGRFEVGRRYNRSTGTFVSANTVPDFADAGAINNNAWNYLVIKYKGMVASATGICQMWINGVNKYDVTSNYVGYDHILQPEGFVKWGIYHWIASYNPYYNMATTRRLLLRSPCIIKDPTGSTYLHTDILAYLQGR